MKLIPPEILHTAQQQPNYHAPLSTKTFVHLNKPIDSE